MVQQVEVFAEAAPESWETLLSAPPFIENQWDDFTYGAGVDLGNETDSLEANYSSSSGGFRMGIWMLSAEGSVELEEDTLYRATCKVASTNTNPPALRFRLEGLAPLAEPFSRACSRSRSSIWSAFRVVPPIFRLSSVSWFSRCCWHWRKAGPFDDSFSPWSRSL